MVSFVDLFCILIGLIKKTATFVLYCYFCFLSLHDSKRNVEYKKVNNKIL